MIEKRQKKNRKNIEKIQNKSFTFRVSVTRNQLCTWKALSKFTQKRYTLH